MPVVLSTPVVPNVPSYDKVHLDSLSITLDRTDYAQTHIQARVRLYYQDPNTLVKTFSLDTYDIVIDDAEAWATALATGGDMRGVDAGTAIRQIVALLVATETTLGNSTVS